MKRTNLLTSATTETRTSKTATMVAREKMKFEKKVADLKYDLKVKEVEFEGRMSSEIEVELADIQTSFAAITKLQGEVNLFESFLATYYSEETTIA